MFRRSLIFISFVCLIFYPKMAFAQSLSASPSPTPMATSSPTQSVPASPVIDDPSQSIYLTNCSWCEGHFSYCHQPTTAPDSQIYSQCYCDTFFQAVYSTCIDSCGWNSAGIPPLTSILSSCNEDNNNNGAAPAPTPTAPTTGEGSGNSPAAGGGNGNGGGNTWNTSPTTVTVGGSHSTKTTGGGNTNPSGGGTTVTSGVDDKDEGHGLLFRVEGAILAGFVVYWIFGWF